MRVGNTDKSIVTAMVQHYLYCFIESVPSIDVPPDFTSVSNVGELEFSTSKNVMDETRKFKTKLFFLRVLNTERSCYSFS